MMSADMKQSISSASLTHQEIVVQLSTARSLHV